MSKSAQVIPPKTAEHYASLARQGKALLVEGDVHTFINSNQVITIILSTDKKTIISAMTDKARVGEIEVIRATAALAAVATTEAITKA